jgi:hypothetical protein
MRCLLVIGVLALLGGCASVPDEVATHSLAGNPRLPDELIRVFYSDQRWREISNREYDAYVIYRGTIERDRSVTFRQVMESWPDRRRVQQAIKYGGEVRLSPIRIGSRVKPGAEVYVLFFETGRTPNQALVFAKQTGSYGASFGEGGTDYLVVWTYPDPR